MGFAVAFLAVGIGISITVAVLRYLDRFHDATPFILIFLVPLFVIPSPYVFAQFGGTASPAMLCGIGMFYVWVMSFVHPPLAKFRRPNAIHVGWFVFFTAMLMSAASAFFRLLGSTEAQAPIRGLAILFGFSGIMLMSTDGIRRRVHLELILRVFVYLGSFVALTGLLQYFTSINLAASLKVPGLEVVNFGEFIGTRNGLKRVSGTAYHPIEYAAVLSALLPIAWYVARWSKRVHGRLYDYIPLIIIASAIPFSLSRTALVALIVIGVSIIPILTIEQKVNIAGYSILFVGALAVLQRRVFRTFMNLVQNAGQDDSISGRTKDYELINDIMGGHAFFGRGIKTFDPQVYFFIDNQFLLSYIESGFVGVAAIVFLGLTALTQASRIRKHADDTRTRELGQVLFASILSIFACFFTFDTLSFPMISLVLFLEIGLVGALSRLEGIPTLNFVNSMPIWFSYFKHKMPVTSKR